jgi:hypothetical protein
LSEGMPIIETYRGVGIHDFQTAERIAEVVKPAIDYVCGLSDLDHLADYAADCRNPPEARLLAAAKAEAAFELAADHREVRPDIDLERLRAHTAGLDSLNWANPSNYCSLFDTWPPGEPEPVPRTVPLRKKHAEAGRS